MSSITRETHARILQMIANGESHRTIAKDLNIGVGTVSEYRHKALSDTGFDVSDSVSQTNETSGDSWKIVLPRTRVSTLEELVEYCKVDLSIWEVERFVANKWEMAAKLGKEEDSQIVVTPLFQVKAFLRKKTSVIAAKQEIEALKELYKKNAHTPSVTLHQNNSGNMLEINIPDPHFGKLAWGVETGGRNYDTKIALKTFLEAVEKLLSRVAGYKFDKVLFVVGNDLLNSDDIEGRTTRGTNVTTDGRYHKTFATVRTMIIGCIERFRKIAPVTVVMVSGNHDALSVWHLGDSLECYFHNYSDVVIDNSPRFRKYFQFGNVMLMFTHGHKGKRNDYPLLMATEQPEMFGKTKFREAHTGHTHQTKVEEQHGVRVRVLPALCPADDWHAENGFVGNLESAEAYIWNAKEGLVGIAIATNSD